MQTDLPSLRSNLIIRDNGYDHQGAPSWILHDDLQNKFFLLGFLEHELLLRWTLGNSEQLIENINSETSLHVTKEVIDNFKNFLRNNFLCEETFHYIKEMAYIKKPLSKKKFLFWLIQNYLFFRIPLLHPDNFLNKTSIIGKFLFSKFLFFLMLFLLISAYYKIAPRWDEFTHTYSEIFTWQGIIILWISILFTKFFHEFGHAYMCKHYGLHIPTMGVVFIVFWPMLYTDTTESWHLDHKKRLWVVSAGLWMETYSAILAAIVWAHVDNLTIQAVAFSMIAVSWLLSVTLNLSPFFRFDGYYFLSDLINTPNLQPRSFSLARWWIRWLLFGLDTKHENLPKNKLRFFILYAFATWIYRFFIFFGIALIVYHYFFKSLGIILFLIEIIFFIIMPITSEIKVWWLLRNKIKLNKHSLISLLILGFLAFIVFYPLKNTVNMSALIVNKNQSFYAPEGSFVENIFLKEGDEVQKGQLIIQLLSEDLSFKQKTSELEMQRISSQLRASAINSEYLTQRDVFISDLIKSQSNYKRYSAQLGRLAIKATFDGKLVELDPYLKKGIYVSKDQWLAEIIDPNTLETEGFINEDEIENLKEGQTGFFYSEEPFHYKLPIEIAYIENSNLRDLAVHKNSGQDSINREGSRVETFTYQAAVFGGKIPVNQTESDSLLPVKSTYRVILSLKQPIVLKQVIRGNIVIYSKRHSLFYHFARFLKQLWVKESHL